MIAHSRLAAPHPFNDKQQRLRVTPNGEYNSDIVDLTDSTHPSTIGAIKKNQFSEASLYSQASTQCSSQSQHDNSLQQNLSILKDSTRTNNAPATNKISSLATSVKNPGISSTNPHSGAKDNKYDHSEFSDIQNDATQGFNYVEDEEAHCMIRTPGGRLLNINKFLMNVDRTISQQNVQRCPAVMNAAFYDASRHCDWVRLENEVDRRSFHFALDGESFLEKFRQFTMMCIFRFFTKWEPKASTIHFAINNLNRIIIARTMLEKTITQQTYAGIAMACIRVAIKHEDTAKFNQLWNNPLRSLWKHAGFGKEIEDYMTLKKINEIEFEAIKILQNPILTPPSPLDFLDRYLSVGGWPSEYISAYRDLAHYIIDLSLFAPKMDGLVGTRPSLLAGAALMLSVKIHNALQGYERYEFWPKRLEVLTNYDAKKLTPVIKALSTLVRNKPRGEELLSKYHEAWANRVWQ